MTVQCRDAEDLPRVPNAGSIATKNGNDVQVMHNGILIEKDCYEGAWMTELIGRLHGHHEPQEERVFDAVMKRFSSFQNEKPVMVELGSHWPITVSGFYRNFRAAKQYVSNRTPRIWKLDVEILHSTRR